MKFWEASLSTTLVACQMTWMANAGGVSSGLDKTSEASLEQPFQNALKNLEHSPCVALYHRNGRSGCGTLSREVQSGPLFYYDPDNIKLSYDENGKPYSSSLPNGQSFVAVMEERDLSATHINTILTANSANNLKGILVLNSTYANGRNPDDNSKSSSSNSQAYDYDTSAGPTYPLGYNTPSAGLSYGNAAYPWNPNGDGLMQFDLYGIPMAYVNEWDTSYYIRQSAKDEEKSVEIYTQFNYYMGPNGSNSMECLEWKDEHDGKWNPKCLPLGGTSVWAFAGSPPQSSNSQNQQAAAEEEEEEEGGRRLEDADAVGAGGNSNEKPTIVVAASMDSTSMFHDLVPGANEGASNILTLAMAAYIVGNYTTDAELDALPNRIVFGFFQGEAYGYLGSRSFLRDTMGFQCSDEVAAATKNKDDDNVDMACLYPMRPSLKFQNLGPVTGMLAVDGLGVPTGEGNLYVHNDGAGGMGTFLANLLKYSGTKNFNAVDSAAGQNNNGDFPYPPSPVTALQSLTGGAYGGAVLTGYDYAFSKRPPYQSHLNWATNESMNLKAIASAATMIARAALAAAYDDGSYDYATAASYASGVISSQLSYKNDVLVELANCLYSNGNCNMLNKYASMEAKKESQRTGFDISVGKALGSPPNYYTGVYNLDYGQPFVRVGDKVYGSYNGEKYGQTKTDAVGLQPRMLSQALRNMMSDFLGRSSYLNDNGVKVSPRSCSKQSDCNGVSYCAANSEDRVICAGSKMCVCERAHYHHALDEALVPAPNNYTGFFQASGDDSGYSPIWSEPYWSGESGVKMYRVSKRDPGIWSIAFGGIVLGGTFFLTLIVKVGMTKQKVY